MYLISDGDNSERKRLDQKAKEEQHRNFDTLAKDIENSLIRCNISDFADISVSGPILPFTEEAVFPSNLYGNTINITGTIPNVNKILRTVFFYAPKGTYDTAVLTISVTDRPLDCTYQYVQEHSAGTVGTRIFKNSKTRTSSAQNIFANFSFCDTLSLVGNTVSKSVNIYITSVNQPPSVTLSLGRFSAVLGTYTAVPTISVHDIDHTNAPVSYDSYGAVQLPPMSVLISVRAGVISLSPVDGISLSQGTGRFDKTVSLFGPYDRLNVALHGLTYSCRVGDGCAVGVGLDEIRVVVSDEGYVGVGGELTATAVLIVDVTDIDR